MSDVWGTNSILFDHLSSLLLVPESGETSYCLQKTANNFCSLMGLLIQGYFFPLFHSQREWKNVETKSANQRFHL